jgi:hypothetical protein
VWAEEEEEDNEAARAVADAMREHRRRAAEAVRRHEERVDAMDAAKPTAASRMGMTGEGGRGEVEEQGLVSVGALERSALWAAPSADPPLPHLFSDRQVRAWGSILRRVTPDRASVSRAATWALDRAELSAHVAAMLGTSLCLPRTALQLRLARLYVAHSVVHDAAQPIARVASLRASLTPLLPTVFAALAEVRRQLALTRGRMSEGVWSSRVGRVLASWRAHDALDHSLLQGLEATFAAPQPVVDAERALLADPSLSTPALRMRALGNAPRGTDDDSTRRLRKRCSVEGLETLGPPAALRLRLLWRRESHGVDSSNAGVWVQDALRRVAEEDRAGTNEPPADVGQPLTPSDVKALLRAARRMHSE